MDGLTRLAMAARDEPAEMGPFLTAVQADVWRLCSGLVDGGHVDDVAQESLIRIMKAVPGFRAESTARTWALRIARYTCADWVRSRQRQRKLASDLADLAPRQSVPSEGGRVELDLLVAGLAEDYRLVFVLTQVLGLGYAEAAEVCECEIGTIRSRVSRARHRLVDGLRSDAAEEHG